jgi:hypothetical protein
LAGNDDFKNRSKKVFLIFKLSKYEFYQSFTYFWGPGRIADEAEMFYNINNKLGVSQLPILNGRNKAIDDLWQEMLISKTDSKKSF